MTRYEDILREANEAAEKAPSRAKALFVVGDKIKVNKTVGGMKKGEYVIKGVATGTSPVGAIQMTGRQSFDDVALGVIEDPMPGANKTERAYGAFLNHEVLLGKVRRWWWQPGSFRLVTMENGHGDFYRPDFMVQRPSGLLEIHETKGFMRDDAQTKLKLFCAIYPFIVTLVKQMRKRDGGGFTFKNYSGSLP